MEMKKCECAPDCPEMIPVKTKHGDPARFKHGHYGRGMKKDYQTGDKHWNWKGGRIPDGKGYILLWMPDHPRANNHGYIREHVYVLEQKLGRYLEKGEIPHHINGIKDDNRPENLTILNNHRQHMIIHNAGNKYNFRDHSKTVCLICGSNKTYIAKRDGRPTWRKYKDGYICKLCYQRKNKPLKPSKPIHKCNLCGSSKTYIDKKNHMRWGIHNGKHICNKCEQRLGRKYEKIIIWFDK